MHVPRIAIPANLTYEEGVFSLALEGLRIAIPANLPYEEGGFSLALQFDPWRCDILLHSSGVHERALVSLSREVGGERLADAVRPLA